MRHIGLVTDDPGHADLFEQGEVFAPRLHAAPADFPFRDEKFTLIPCDLTRLAESGGDELGVGLRVLVPIADTCRRVDAHAAGWSNAEFTHLAADRNRLAHLRQEAFALLLRPHRRAAARTRPDGSHERADLETVAGDLVDRALNLLLIAVDRDVRISQPQINAVEFDAIHLSLGG